jgi:2,3-bisphosphoglycerate-dependent phosphoglycerate mutase
MYYNTFMAKICVFRHGQTIDNLDHDFSGIHDVDLTTTGIEEARRIGEKLKSEPVRKAYQSNLIRSQHTLELVLNGFHKGVEIITDARIEERNYGDLTGLNKDELEKIDPKDFALWHRSYDVAPPNGESIKDVEVRVLAFLKDALPTWKKDDVIFISAHGNSIRPMRRYFEHLTIDQMCSYENVPGKIYEYQI